MHALWRAQLTTSAVRLRHFSASALKLCAVVASAFEVLHAGALMVDKGIVAAGADEGELGSWDATA